jgi:cell wall-associated NlpC family hydrolase
LKKFYKLLLTTTVLSISGHAATKTIQYKIKSGDTLSEIAQKNGTTVSSIQKINKLEKDQKLKLGKELKILAKVKTVNHTIKSGDTLSVLAVKNNTTVASIIEENGLTKDQKLKLGKVIAIPTEATDIKKSKKIASVEKSKVKTKKKSKKSLKVASTKKSKVKTKKKSKKSLKVASSKKSKIKTKKKQVKKVAVTKKKKNIKVASKRKTQKKKLVDRLTRVKFAKSNKPKKVKFTLGNALMNTFGNSKSTKMIKLAKKKLGRKYVWGATGKKNTFDCSGLTKFVCKSNGIKIPRRAIQQSKYGKQISRSNLKPGDLIFFDTSKQKKGFVNHVGIYLGNNKFIHASSAKKKVVISPLHKNFYSKRYRGARRVSSL